MRTNRGTAVFGILVALVIVLTLVLAVAVYQGISSRNHAVNNVTMPYFFQAGQDQANNSMSGQNSGLLLGGAPMTTIHGSWQYKYSTDIVTFMDSALMFNFDFEHQKPYTTHRENVGTSDGSTRSVTVYSTEDNPWGGWAIIDTDLYMVGYDYYFGWLTSQKMTPLDPILGSWRSASDNNPNDQYKFAFDGSHYISWYTSWPPQSQKQYYFYKKMDNVWVRKYTDDSFASYQDYHMTIYRTDVDSYSSGVNLLGYGFIDGKLYSLWKAWHGSGAIETLDLFECVRC